MESAKLLAEVVDRVSKYIDFDSIQTYPREDHPEVEQRGTSFQVLIQIVISQRATLEKEMQAAQRLFHEFNTPEDIASASPERVAELIKPAGMHRKKAATIIRISKEILSTYNGNIDELRKLPPEEIRLKLLGLHGVGPKTADCMLELGFAIPYLPVDVNVDRVSKRLGLVHENAGKEDVRTTLEGMITKDIKVYRNVHTFLLALGKYYCKSSPLCYKCPVADLCSYTEKRLNGNQ